ncbi:UNVERIFIED_CONTAM: phloem protein 2 [Sesamum latifolium]|uniref:Phloem protein 2 n=1 Tax=Sesamum latifolium TaxID=2727402 RepID=A0AAW2YG65_9LAMI
MKGVVLEVLLVSAEGIDHTNIVGSPTYHVIVQCGTQVCRSKTSSGNPDIIYWNEKFTFELPPSELETLSHLKLRIVNEEYFSDGEFVGETIIFLKGIIVESNYKGLVELSPAPFNVVLEDDTYKGQITIGLKFIPSAVLQMKRKQCIQEERDIDESICRMVVRLWEMPWWGHLFSNKHKKN